MPFFEAQQRTIRQHLSLTQVEIGIVLRKKMCLLEPCVLLSSPINRGTFGRNNLWLCFLNLFVTACASGSTAKQLCSVQTTNKVCLNATLVNILTASHRCGHSSLRVLSLWAEWKIPCPLKLNWLYSNVRYGSKVLVYICMCMCTSLPCSCSF